MSKLMMTLHAFLYLFTSTGYLFWFRMAQGKDVPFLIRGFSKLIWAMSGKILNIDISLETQIGLGFYLGHGQCIVVNPTAKIESNVNLSQFCNIGSNIQKGAVIGDEVYIGPHVCIVDDVTIGDKATIGAGAVVTRDVPPGATVAGVPAKILNSNNPGRFIGNKYIVAFFDSLDISCQDKLN